MPIKIDIQTNINDYELTIENCSQIISLLQETYKNIRKEMYNQFLGKKNLYRAVIFAMVCFGLYFLTQDMFFAYFMPVSVIFSMISSIIGAEYFTSQSRKQIHKQIEHYIQQRDILLRKQKFKE